MCHINRRSFLFHRGSINLHDACFSIKGKTRNQRTKAKRSETFIVESKNNFAKQFKNFYSKFAKKMKFKVEPSS